MDRGLTAFLSAADPLLTRRAIVPRETYTLSNRELLDPARGAPAVLRLGMPVYRTMLAAGANLTSRHAGVFSAAAETGAMALPTSPSATLLGKNLFRAVHPLN